MTRILRQNAPEWGSLRLGTPLVRGVTIGGGGCLLCCLAMAHNELCGGDLTPPTAQDLILDSGSGFLRANLSIEAAAPALGLVAPDSERVRGSIGAPVLTKAAHAAMIDGLCIFHVDSDQSGRAFDDDDSGKHFILAARIEGGDFICHDPAPGRVVRLDARTLSGKAMWGKVLKVYRVVSTIPVRKAETVKAA